MLEKGFFHLLENPFIGKARPDVKQGYRALQIEKHIIFYCVGTEFIDIAGIPHIRMDVKRHIESV